MVVADYHDGAPCLILHDQVWESQTGVVAGAPYWTGVVGRAYSSARAEVLEYRALEVGEYPNGVLFPCLHAQAPE